MDVAMGRKLRTPSRRNVDLGLQATVTRANAKLNFGDGMVKGCTLERCIGVVSTVNRSAKLTAAATFKNKNSFMQVDIASYYYE